VRAVYDGDTEAEAGRANPLNLKRGVLVAFASSHRIDIGTPSIDYS
jgi:hypothetical protein